MPPLSRLLAAALLLSLAAAAPAAELRRGPYLQVPRPDGITIRWRTDTSVRYTSVLRYGDDPDNLDHAVSAKEANDHFSGVRDWEVTLDGLKPDTKYYYAIEADRATLCGADERTWFRTAPEAGKPRKLRLWLLGDSGSNRPRSDELKAVLAQKGPIDPVRVRNGFRKFNRGKPLDGILLLGDNAYPTGTDEQYQAALFNVYADELRHAPLWPCVGNHDIDDAYRFIFTPNGQGKTGGVASENPYYYAADLAHLHLAVLDPWKTWWQETTDVKHAPWQKQLDWLRRDLAANKQEWTFVVNHFPVYCDGDYDSDTNAPLKSLREQLVPLLDKHGVDLCLAGHDHTYQRSFLLKGLTGLRGDHDAKRHRLSDSDGRTAPIRKRPGADGGTLYVVSGTGGGSRTKGKLEHPVMVPFENNKGKRGLAVPGSLVLEIDGRTLRGWNVDEQGQVLDEFTLVREPAKKERK